MQHQSNAGLELQDTTTLAREYLDDMESIFWAIRMLSSNDDLSKHATKAHVDRLVGIGEERAMCAADIFSRKAEALEVAE